MKGELRYMEAFGFDLDGTFYPLTPEINDRVRTKISEKILEKKPNLRTVENARKFFEKEYAEIQSGSGILKKVGYENSSQIMDECLAQADVLDLINPNKELGKIIGQLSSKYNELYLLTSSPEELSLSKLERIGIDNKLFSYMVFGDTPEGGSKTTGEAFDYVLSLSQIPPSKHVYFGDRKKSDILPAKKRGMKTVAVHNNIPEADFFISNINNIEDLLL